MWVLVCLHNEFRMMEAGRRTCQHFNVQTPNANYDGNLGQSGNSAGFCIPRI